DLLRLAGDVPAGRQLLERLPDPAALRLAAEPGVVGFVVGTGLRRQLWPQLLHRDGRAGADGRVPLLADLPARRGAEREGEGEVGQAFQPDVFFSVRQAFQPDGVTPG